MAFKARLNFFGRVYHVLQRAFALNKLADFCTVPIPVYTTHPLLRQRQLMAARRNQYP